MRRLFKFARTMGENFTTSSRGQMESFVREALQKNNEEEIKKIANKLLDLGVEKSNDLLDLNEKDLTEGGTIKLVHAKKLKKHASQGEYFTGSFNFVVDLMLYYLST